VEGFFVVLRHASIMAADAQGQHFAIMDLSTVRIPPFALNLGFGAGTVSTIPAGLGGSLLLSLRHCAYPVEALLRQSFGGR
jgi:hypothetical protein